MDASLRRLTVLQSKKDLETRIRQLDNPNGDLPSDADLHAIDLVFQVRGIAPVVLVNNDERHLLVSLTATIDLFPKLPMS